jgi:hypothetical protein
MGFRALETPCGADGSGYFRACSTSAAIIQRRSFCASAPVICSRQMGTKFLSRKPRVLLTSLV